MKLMSEWTIDTLSWESFFFSERIKFIICDEEDDGEDREDFLCTGDVDLLPLSRNQNISVRDN